MKGCRHADWVEVSDSSNVNLIDPGRLERLVKTLRSPVHQYPQIVACMGGEEKRHAVAHLFHKSTHLLEPRPHGLAELHVDVSRSDLNHPVFFVDCAPAATLPVRKDHCKCHEKKSSVQTAGAGSQCSTENTVLTRLIFPFLDAICIFADDFNGLDAVLAHLEEWTAGEVAATLPWKVRPRVSIVTFAPLTSEALREQKVFNSRLRAIKSRRHFSSVRLVRFWPRSTPVGRYKAVEQLLLHDELGTARVRRKSERFLFAAHHLPFLFSQALLHVGRTSDRPFDFIAASRALRPLPPDYADQLSAFLRLAVEKSLPFEVIASIVASSIVMDAYPPTHHGESIPRV